jgi:hypothetical protein
VSGASAKKIKAGGAALMSEQGSGERWRASVTKNYNENAVA